MKKPFVCKYEGCTKAYTTRFSLRRHIESHSAVKPHVCMLCFKTFTLAQYLKEHTYIHTEQRPFKCDFAGCNRSFRQAGKLSMHKRTHRVPIFKVEKVKRLSVLSQNVAAEPEIEIESGGLMVAKTATTHKCSFAAAERLESEPRGHGGPKEPSRALAETCTPQHAPQPEHRGSFQVGIQSELDGICGMANPDQSSLSHPPPQAVGSVTS